MAKGLISTDSDTRQTANLLLSLWDYGKGT